MKLSKLLAVMVYVVSSSALAETIDDPFYDGVVWTATSSTETFGSGPDVCPLVATGCFETITQSFQGEAIDGDVEYLWLDPRGQTIFSGTVRTGASISPTSSYGTFLAERGTGLVKLTNVGLESKPSSSGSVDMWFDAGNTWNGQANGGAGENGNVRDGTDTILGLIPAINDTTSLISRLSGSPEKIRFTSSVTRLGADEFQYDYFVHNYTDYAIDFDWYAAGLSGTVDAQSDGTPGLFEGPTIIGGLPRQISGTAMADLTFEIFGETVGENQFVFTANAITPVPIPAAAWLFGSAILGLVMLRRRNQ